MAKNTNRVIKTYTEDEILNVADEKTKVIYYELKKNILDLGDDIEVRPTKTYIAYRRNRGFAAIVVLRHVLKIYLSIKSSTLRDPLNMTRNVEEIGHYAHGDTEITVKNEKEIPYVTKLVQQSYKIY